MIPHLKLMPRNLFFRPARPLRVAAAVVILFALLLPATASALEPSNELTVMSYNVRNYLRMDRYIDNVQQPDTPKPEKEIEALLRIVAAVRPDVLAIQEMGPPDQFEDFRNRLAAHGEEHPHAFLLQAHDENRHLALLSRFPIVAENSVDDAVYELNGVQEAVQRGFLDVTVEAPGGYRLRIVNVHLKSKRPVPQGEALMRRREAGLLRKHVDAILAANPGVNLLLTGDFNDLKNQPPIQDIEGVRGSPSHMGDVLVSDLEGDRWTQYWSAADVYSRFDYFFASPGLWPEIEREKSRIVDVPIWRDASDHRAIVAVISPQDR